MARHQCLECGSYGDHGSVVHKEEGEGDDVQGVGGDEESPEAKEGEEPWSYGGGGVGAPVLHPEVFDRQ